MNTKGLFIAIEGTDGSGKGTQFTLLVERLRAEGYDVATFDFPQYDEPSSYFVKKYLNGKYGTANDVGPYAGSLLYALDRFDAAHSIREALAMGKVVITNRFTGSNMAHQGTKFVSSEERRGYFLWLDNLEFEMLKIPRPTKSLVLRVPADIAQSLVDTKGARSYTDKKRDIHESDLEHMQKSVEIYDEMCQLFPKDFHRIDCVRNGNLMSIETIQNYVWQSIEPLLPPLPTSKSAATVQSDAAPHAYIHKQADGSPLITEDGYSYLENIVTDTTGDVYAFKESQLGVSAVAAAMARLSRRADDMRITILDEFAGQEGRDAKLLERVITAYGDDSVQQLVGQHIVVEDASNLLTKQIEWGRLASYLEQSTRYIYFDKRDQHGRFKYYRPQTFDEKTLRHYEIVMDEIFETYSDLVHKMTDYFASVASEPAEQRDGAWRSAIRAEACDAARAVLPVATQSTVGIFASGQALEYMVMRLRASDSAEARRAGTKILQESRKVIPTFLKRADDPAKGGATTLYMSETNRAVAELGREYLPDHYAAQTKDVNLIKLTPTNELDLIPYMLYDTSNLPLQEIQAAVASWPIARKLEVFNAYMGNRLNRRHKPGRALEHAHYEWDLVCDYGIFRDLQRHRIVNDLRWQPLTPRYGFEIPDSVEEAGLADEFERCFDLATKLYSDIQAAGYQYEAQYATLLGHKMRWTISYNAREAFHLHELRTSPQGHSGYRKLVNQMHTIIADRHPMLAEAMKFVNKDEDPELSRLAAERYSQSKLAKLSEL